MNALEKAWDWIKAKFGRIATAAGFLLQGIETVDISAIKDPLESFLGHKGVQAIVVGLFAASYVRHQYVANQHQTPTPASDGK